jgi:uncharacterized repeat protein (TIGR03803 family)
MRTGLRLVVQLRLRNIAWMIVLFSAATAIFSPAQTITTLLSFDGSNGSYPLGTLVQGSDGDFYGTTSEGGIYSPFLYGTIFKVTPDGTLTTLHNFSGNDGDQPQVALAHATDGSFYGTTFQGGAANYGTIFKITASGAFTLLYTFSGDGDGRYPGPLIQGSDGNFYGTALGGGNHNCYTTDGCGLVFKITPQGNFTKIYQFQGSSNDGYNPVGLVQGRDGNFYGMSGGFSQVLCHANCGSVFKLTPTGHFSILHWFNGRDGNFPSGQLLQATDGNFYGTTSEGGAYSEGTVFQMTPSGSLTSLYSFCSQGNCPDGAYPLSGVMQATDGTLYGTTAGGGVYGCTTCGTVFEMTTNGNLTTLYSFDDLSHGGSPGGLLQASNGNFYALTSGGGTSYYRVGTFFQFFTTGRTLTVGTTGNGTATSTDGVINCPGTCTHIYANNAPVTLNASAPEGWTFDGWDGACRGTGSCQIDMTQDQLVWAYFSPFYTLTVTTNGSGSVRSTDGFIDCPGVCSHVYVANTPVTLNNFPAPGWILDSWSGSCIGNSPTCQISMGSDRSVGATFTQAYYTLTASLIGQGTITSSDGYINCPGACSHTYLSLTEVTLNATPGQDWAFGGWTGACSGVGPCTLTMLQNSPVSAYFVDPGSGLQLMRLQPCRVVDTRGDHNPIYGGTSRDFAIPRLGNCNVPGGAAGYSLNVTVVPHGPLGYLTLWPKGLAQPNVSTLNSYDARVKANAAIVPSGLSGAVSVYVTDTTDVILDIDGYFAQATPSSLQFYPLTPCRVADTRDAQKPTGLGPPHLHDMEARELPVLSSPCLQGLPQQPQAYSFNVTVVPNPGGPLNYLTVWPSDRPQPFVSTLNNPTATVVANAAIVPAAATSGDISVFAYNSTDVIVDVNGYFAAPGQGGFSFYPAAPCRVLDTRGIGSGQPFIHTLSPPVNVVGSPCAPPSNAGAYVFNATVVPANGPMGYLTLWPDSEGQPIVSTLNAYDGFTTSNMAIVPNVNGSIDAYADGLTQLILDISGYFAP